jgi:hypothetical protein
MISQNPICVLLVPMTIALLIALAGSLVLMAVIVKRLEKVS